VKRVTKKTRNLQEIERKKKDKVKKLRGQKKAKETKMKTIRLHERLNICVSLEGRKYQFGGGG
jgi:hypothetical protein